MGPPVGTANSIRLASAIACIVDKNCMVRVMLTRCRAGQIILTHSPRGDHGQSDIEQMQSWTNDVDT